MNKYNRNLGIAVAVLLITLSACKIPTLAEKTVNKAVPAGYIRSSQDTTNIAASPWRSYFKDPDLVALIDSALNNNQELNILLQEIEVSRNEVQARKGEYLPFVNVGGAAAVDKTPRYTSKGASEATTEIEPGKAMPEPMPDLMMGAFASWEVDIWRKLRNARQAAVKRYLASVEGRNFVITGLISEIADSYYELLALDNQLAIVKQNIEVQTNALEIVKAQKEAGRVTELAVKRFEALVLHTKSLQFGIQQRIVQTENRINFLVGRYPQPVKRNSANFIERVPDAVFAGVPSQLLENRPDVRQAELELAACQLDVKSARANFYPSLHLSAGLGLQAFKPVYLANPESILFSLAGDLMGPVINRNAIKAQYANANARQIQAVYNYERTVLNAYIEVSNQVASIDNLAGAFDMKSKEVQALIESVVISNDLFSSARADYMEVLLTQRDLLESRFDQIETKQQQLIALVNIYRALGGGWK